MAKLGKRLRALREQIGNPRQPRGIDEVLALVKTIASAKFDETVDVAVNLGVDPRKSDQVVRGSTVLPHGTGKSVRVALLLTVPTPKPAALPVPTSSASMILPPRSRLEISISTSP